MSPQNPSFNRGIWETLESRVRTWANEKNEAYVITTPFLKNICTSIKNEMIFVTCPYYKIVIALILNNQGSCSIIKSFATRIDDISPLILFLVRIILGSFNFLYYFMNEFIICGLILVVVIYLISKKKKKEPLKNFGVKTINKITGRPFKIGNLEVAQNNFPEDINWTDAKKACDTLGEGWRLPSKDELNILFDINKVNDILCLEWKRYWTYSEGISRSMKSGMWTQETVFGDQNTYSKLKLVRVRAVRDSEPKEIQTVSSSIIMSTTNDPNDIIGSPFKIGNLEVAQNDFPKEMRYVDAIKECEALGDGWRLPTKSELNNLYKNQDKIGGFVHFVYWSSSSSKDDGRYRWRQEFSFGSQGGSQ